MLARSPLEKLSKRKPRKNAEPKQAIRVWFDSSRDGILAGTIENLRTKSEGNELEHWRYSQKRNKAQRTLGFTVASRLVAGERDVLRALRRTYDVLPCVVTLTRIAPRKLDAHDGLPSSNKHIVDGIADAFGIKDNDPRIEWLYAQERGEPRQYAVRIEIEKPPPSPSMGGMRP